jgi:cephalosporin hydroxylase
MTFEDAMRLTRTVSAPAAFEDPECEAYFQILMTLPEDALIVEVGLEYGRSSSIALQVAKEKNLRYVGIDPFPDNDVYTKWLDMAGKVGFENTVVMREDSGTVRMTDPISAILIDGDHTYNAVFDDLSHFLPLLVNGGYAMLHDYGRDSLPDVSRAAYNYFGKWTRRWEALPPVGTLGIWRKR